ncbi:MAG: plasmid pRiA4b ORF-3 family protein [Candidatus Eremiobacteraeota bacterium]|nr:plasmid pRiA4b ORF-3 family protein [Candidatus Eremiobacteraeota bacterium]MCW5869608.1 plasmid pRiA4b ORF-3 family protein [Candidatus Eremiobacteraeota bacterium]
MSGSIVLRCTLVDSEPAIWRTLQLPGRFPLGRLHKALQVVFGWEDYHLHEFEIEGMGYTHPDLIEEPWEAHQDEAQVRVSELPECSYYRYDPGDGWEVELRVVKRLPEELPPLLLEGEHPGPPEDCGGISGLYELNEVLRNPQHDEYQEMKVWARRYHPDKFSLESLRKAWNRAFPPPKARRVVVPVSPARPDFPLCAYPLEKYRLEKLSMRTTMLAALLERGRPMTLEELAERLQQAGVSLPGGLDTLKRAWRQDNIFYQRQDGRLEVYREHPEIWRYEFDLCEVLELDEPSWATTPLRADEFANLTNGFNRADYLLAGLDSLEDGVLLADFEAIMRERGKNFKITPVLAVLPVTLNHGAIKIERQHTMLQALRLRVRRQRARSERIRSSVRAELPEPGRLVTWDGDCLWVRNLAGGPDQTLKREEGRTLLAGAEVVYAPHVLQLYDVLDVEARRQTYRYDLMPLEFSEGTRNYPPGVSFENFLDSTVGKRESVLDRLEAYWRHGFEHGFVLLGRQRVRVWWNPAADRFNWMRSPLLKVEM